MGFINSPNMSLPIPNVGSEPGPDYAVDVNNSLTLIDQHDHTPGKGVQLTPSSLNINTALNFNDNLATELTGLTLIPQGASPGVNTIYEQGVDLYYTDGLGNNIRLTQSGGIAGAPGSIAGLVSPASATYIPVSSTFVWQSNVNTAANMDFGAAILRNLTPNSTFSLKVQPPSGLVSNSTITLPLAPVANSFLTISPTGVITGSIPTAGGITGSNIASATITGSNIAAMTVAGSNIVNNTITYTQLDPTVLTANEVDILPVVASFAVRVATTVNGAIGTAFDVGSTVDGVVLILNDIILLKNQTTTTDNGVYVVNAAPGAPTRHVNYDTFSELNYAAVTVTAGTVNTGLSWFQNNILTALSDPQSWSQSSTQAYTVPANMNTAEFVYVGGGGGGGGGAGSPTSGGGTGAGGGGAGSTPKSIMVKLIPGQNINITIGFGGAGGIAGNNLSGSLGGKGDGGGGTLVTGAALGVLSLYAPGGEGGDGGNGSGLGRTGGIGGDTYVNAPGYVGFAVSPGGDGGDGFTGISATNGKDAPITYLVYDFGTGGIAGIGAGGGGGGAGGSGLGPGPDGGNGGNSGGSDAVVGGNATNPGAGGSGAGGARNSQGSGKIGGRGANGKVIIRWFGEP